MVGAECGGIVVGRWSLVVGRFVGNCGFTVVRNGRILRDCRQKDNELH
jgi:hypothetical protein